MPGEPPPGREDMDIGVIHYISEEFDNYWGSAGQSKRVAWLRILDLPRTMYAKVFGKIGLMYTPQNLIRQWHWPELSRRIGSLATLQ